MATPHRTAHHGTFFVTSITWNRLRLFQTPECAELFLATLQHYRREGHFKLHAFVAMPEHVHLLLTPTGGPLERAMMLIKGGFSHRLASSYPVWQKGFTDHRICDREDFLAHRDYIHCNPVRAGLCQQPGEYAFSSAYDKPEAPKGADLVSDLRGG